MGNEETTKTGFAKNYPDGLNEIILAFREAVYRIFATDEIDKIIKYAPKKEAKRLAEIKEAFEIIGVERVGDIPPWYPLIDAFSKTPYIYPDILVHMFAVHKKAITGAELEERLSYHIDRDQEESEE